jgi:hypothetical protein
VSSDFFLITREISVYTKDKYSLQVLKECFSIWRRKFDTDLVRSSPVYKMYCFEMPVGAEDVDYHR